MNNFFIVLLTISITGSILFIFLLFIDRLLNKYEVTLQYTLMKLILLFYFVPAVLIPINNLIKITPIKVETKGADIHSWISYAKGSEYIFNQHYNKLSLVLLVVWLIGVVYVFVGDILKSKRLLTQIYILSTKENDLEINSIKDRLLTELKINKNIEIYRSNLVDSPCISGIIQTKILLPTELFSEIEIELVLKHELYHYKKNDIFFNMLILVFHGIYWFNPIIRCFTSRMNSFCEMSCDRYVLRNSTKEVRCIYADLLLRIANKAGNKKKYGLTTFVSQNEKYMKRRLSNIMKLNLQRKNFFLTAGIIFTIVLCPITTYASAIGTTHVYNKILSYTNSRELEKEDKMQGELIKEYYGSIGDSTYFSVDTRGTNLVDMKIKPDATSTSSSVLVQKGGTIKVFISGENTTDKFKIVIKLGEEVKAKETSKGGDINYTYTVDTKGSYSVSIINLSSSNTIHVSGSIIIKQ